MTNTVKDNHPLKILTNTHNFVKFRSGNYIYVDKTQFVYQLLENDMTQCFLSRPRRFGKSLLLDMMKELFLGNKALFKGLYIYDRYDFKPYPVIHLTFTKLQYDATLDPKISLSNALKRYLGKIANENQIPMPDGPYLDSLIEDLYKKTKSPVVLLIDEYDKPLLRYIKNVELRNIALNTLKDFFSPLKDLTHIVKFLFITGVSKFSQVSIFSDLNHPDDLTLHDDYATITGFTQQELEHYFKDHIIQLAEKEGKTKDEILNQIKYWYDGYSWDGKSFVYAPFSISNLFKRFVFKNYWFSSATPSFLIDVIDELKKGTLTLQSFESHHMFDTDMEKYEISDIRLMPFLFQSGYLSIYEKNLEILKVRMPNMEVRSSFYNHLFEQLSPGNPEQLDLLRNAISDCNIDKMMNSLKSIIATIPYQILDKKENVYHSHFYTILKTINENTQSEISTNLGRIDTVMETHDTIFIFEFKMQSALQGIRQIKKKKYAQGYFNKNKKIVLIGVKFSKTNRNIADYKYEQVRPENLIEWEASEKIHTEQILIFYSTHDEPFKDKIFSHVQMLADYGIKLIDDITFDEIETTHSIPNAKIAVLLISHNLLGSTLFKSNAMLELIKRIQTKKITLFLIIVKPCAYKAVRWLADYKINAEPLTALSELEQDKLLADIVNQIAQLVPKKRYNQYILTKEVVFS